MGGNAGVWGVIGFLLLASAQPAHAIKRMKYQPEDGFRDSFNFALQKVSSEARRTGDSPERSALLADLVSYKSYNGNEIVLTSYTDEPLPRAIVRWKVVPYEKTEILSMDPYMERLRATPRYSRTSWLQLTTYWSEALLLSLRTLLTSQEPGQNPWLIEIVHDALGAKTSLRADPTKTVHQLELRITTPSGNRFVFDRTTEFESILGIASLAFDVVKNGETFLQKDWSLLPRVPGLVKLSDRARSRRFLKENESLREYRFLQSKALCKDFLKAP